VCRWNLKNGYKCVCIFSALNYSSSYGNFTMFAIIEESSTCRMTIEWMIDSLMTLSSWTELSVVKVSEIWAPFFLYNKCVSVGYGQLNFQLPVLERLNAIFLCLFFLQENSTIECSCNFLCAYCFLVMSFSYWTKKAWSFTSRRRQRSSQGSEERSRRSRWPTEQSYPLNCVLWASVSDICLFLWLTSLKKVPVFNNNSSLDYSSSILWTKRVAHTMVPVLIFFLASIKLSILQPNYLLQNTYTSYCHTMFP